jgi:hypothetical protein
MKYYFFAATLPLLSMEGPPPFSMVEFRARCTEHLTADDSEALAAVMGDTAGAATSHGFVRKWRDLDTAVRNAVARARAARLQRDAAPYLRPQAGVDVQLEKGVADAFQKTSPLDRERALDRLVWNRLDDAAGHDPFDGKAILAYAVRLRILERWSRLDESAGKRVVMERVATQQSR